MVRPNILLDIGNLSTQNQYIIRPPFETPNSTEVLVSNKWCTTEFFSASWFSVVVVKKPSRFSSESAVSGCVPDRLVLARVTQVGSVMGEELHGIAILSCMNRKLTTPSHFSILPEEPNVHCAWATGIPFVFSSCCLQYLRLDQQRLECTPEVDFTTFFSHVFARIALF